MRLRAGFWLWIWFFMGTLTGLALTSAWEYSEAAEPKPVQVWTGEHDRLGKLRFIDWGNRAYELVQDVNSCDDEGQCTQIGTAHFPFHSLRVQMRTPDDTPQSFERETLFESGALAFEIVLIEKRQIPDGGALVSEYRLEFRGEIFGRDGLYDSRIAGVAVVPLH